MLRRGKGISSLLGFFWQVFGGVRLAGSTVV